jgi:hypothetical protein
MPDICHIACKVNYNENVEQIPHGQMYESIVCEYRLANAGETELWLLFETRQMIQ